MHGASAVSVAGSGVIAPVLLRARDLRPLVLLLITDDPGGARL